MSNIKTWIQQGKKIIQELETLSEEGKKECDEFLHILNNINTSNPPRLYLIVNQGIHPIEEDLKRQFGEDIRYEVVTRGNVQINQEAEIARRVQEIVQKHHGAEFVIVPSGLPYVITAVYNTVLQITSKHPVYLQLDRENGRYVEKVLDPRKMIV